MGGWPDSRVGLDVLERRKFLALRTTRQGFQPWRWRPVGNGP